MRSFIKNLVCGAVLGVAGMGAASVQAGDWYGSHCRTVAVVTYETRQEAFKDWVTVYDDHGCPRRVLKVFYRTVKVPVTKFVKVCH